MADTSASTGGPRESEEHRGETLLDCDLIMKGGVTSGVVYPPAILELASKFRFRHIAGASAGAIAAAVAACAEYTRRRGQGNAGFEGVRRLEEEVAEPGFLLRRFRPSGAYQELFDALWHWLEVSKAEAAHPRRPLDGRRTWRLVRRLWQVAGRAFGEAQAAGMASGFLAGVVITSGLWSWLSEVMNEGPLWLRLLAIVPPLLGCALSVGLAALGGVVAAAWRAVTLVRALASEPESGFGVCTGSLGDARSGHDARELPLTDWLHARLNELAGRRADEPSPTFAELAVSGVTLRLVTTNVTLGQPWTLPLRRGSRSFYFREEEAARLFPPVVVQQLVSWAKAHPPTKLRFRSGEEGRYLRFPLDESLPVLVATRLSLSFPLLLGAVRLYSFASDAYVRSARGEVVDLEKDVEAHWLSDGGIASNFPIHLFDAWIPAWPTFGITLYDSPVRRVLDQLEGVLSRPVVLPRPREFDLARPRRVDVDGLRDFLAAIFNTAQSFRDVAQSTLPSYRERIVQIFLEPHEGGLNLNMSPQVVRDIQEKGRRAGRLLLERYHEQGGGEPRLSDGFLEHRWVRMLVLFGQLEVELGKLRALGGAGPEWRAEVRRIFDELLVTQGKVTDGWYRPKDAAWTAEASRRIEALLDFVQAWGRMRGVDDVSELLFSREPPRPEAILRVTPDI